MLSPVIRDFSTNIRHIETETPQTFTVTQNHIFLQITRNIRSKGITGHAAFISRVGSHIRTDITHGHSHRKRFRQFTAITYIESHFIRTNGIITCRLSGNRIIGYISQREITQGSTDSLQIAISDFIVTGQIRQSHVVYQLTQPGSI